MRANTETRGVLLLFDSLHSSTGSVAASSTPFQVAGPSGPRSWSISYRPRFIGTSSCTKMLGGTDSLNELAMVTMSSFARHVGRVKEGFPGLETVKLPELIRKPETAEELLVC